MLETLTGDKISVGAPFFNLTVGPLVIPILLLMPIGQSLAWKRGDFLGAAQRVMVAAVAGVTLSLVLAAALRGGPVLAPIGVGLAVYLILGSSSELLYRGSGANGRPGGRLWPARLGFRVRLGARLSPTRGSA